MVCQEERQDSMRVSAWKAAELIAPAVLGFTPLQGCEDAADQAHGEDDDEYFVPGHNNPSVDKSQPRG